VARAGGVPIMALLSVIPARGWVGRAAPPQPAVGSSRARGWGKGRRSGHGAGPEGGGDRNAFGVGVDGGSLAEGGGLLAANLPRPYFLKGWLCGDGSAERWAGGRMSEVGRVARTHAAGGGGMALRDRLGEERAGGRMS
jgi:hypothetical protein